MNDIFRAFSNLTDPRLEWTRHHELFDIVVVAVCTTIAGADSWADIERFGVERLEWLRTFLRLENGIPSHDTFGRVFSRLDPAKPNQATSTMHFSVEPCPRSTATLQPNLATPAESG